MSFSDDQALNGLLNGHPYNFLDVAGSEIGNCKDTKEAIKVVAELENRLKEKKVEGKTVIDPEKKEYKKIDQQQLLKGIQEDMEK